jgi:hypothetical protein
MSSLIQIIEKELNIPKAKLVKEGLKHFLAAELRNLSIEIKKRTGRYGVDSFEGLWEKLEAGEVTEAECFDDLTKIEHLELEREKITKLLKKAG